MIFLHQSRVLLFEAKDELFQVAHLRLLPVASGLSRHSILQLAPHHFLFFCEMRKFLSFSLRRRLIPPFILLSDDAAENRRRFQNVAAVKGRCLLGAVRSRRHLLLLPLGIVDGDVRIIHLSGRATFGRHVKKILLRKLFFRKSIDVGDVRLPVREMLY